MEAEHTTNAMPPKDGLNEQQQAAVEATEGRVRVVAGAGTGKTRVVAHRYAHLVNHLGIDPANILCMTFTNKAAQEMKLRIGQLVDRGNVNDFVCTIHGFCVKFLRHEIFRIGYPATFSIMDETDCADMAKQAFDELHVERKQKTVRQFLDQLGRYKFAHREDYIEQYLLAGGSTQPHQVDVTVRYLQLQLKYFSLDFDDLEYFTIYILHHFKEARDYWLGQLDYIIVDEVQDCSRDDWEIIDLLATGQGNLCIVGDPDQSIYEWRGAVPDKLVNFACDTDVILSRNYRSTPQILDVANQIIANNRLRVPKNLCSHRPAGAKPVHYHAIDLNDEARYIVGEIKALTASGTAPYALSDCAVLYRASYLSRPIEQMLIREHINYSMWGGVRFFERREIKDCIAYLHFVAYLDDFSLLRIINVPSRRFGKRSVERLRQLQAQQQLTSLWQTLASNADDPKFKQSRIAQFVKMVTDCRAKREDLKVSDLMELLLNSSGLKDALRADEDEERLENVNELIGSMRDYEKDNEFDPDQTVVNYLRHVALLTNADYRREGPSVKLMTIHQAKGLEFACVWVCGLTEGVFPSHRTIRERKQNGEEEERRLMYVAVTRAKDRLYLTESEGYNAVTQATRYPSRYFCEVKPEALELQGRMEPELLRMTQLIASELNDELGYDGNVAIAPEPDFKAGDLVRHKVFGSGVVLAHIAEHNSYRVRFGDRERSIVSGFLEKDDDQE